MLVLLGVIALGASVDLLRIRRDLDAGRASLSGLDLESLDEGLVPSVERATSQLRDADRVADRSPFLASLTVLPIIGSQVDAVRDLTEVAEDLGETGLESARAIDAQLQRAGGEPSARVDLLDTVLEEMDRIEGAVESIDVGAEGELIGPLATARTRVVDELGRLPARLDEAGYQVRAMRRLLAGPSRYLLLGANNAEMRGGAGMPLTAAVITISDGDIDFSDTFQLSGLDVGKPLVQYPSAWQTTYRRWRPGRSYLSTAVSPNFPVTGPIYRAMAPTAGIGAVDGVLELDAVGLRHLLEVIGPVEMDGITYDAGNIEEKVLFENYLSFDELAERDDRIEIQSRIAKQIFEAFKSRDIPITRMATALQTAAKGRHLLASSADPFAQSVWESIGADGSLSPFGLMVTAQNVSANKQDWFLDPRVTVNVVPATDGSWRARLTVTIANPVPERTSAYIDGSYKDLRNGTHRTMVAVYLPATAYDVRSLDQAFSEGGDDPPMQMYAKRIDIERGQERRISMEFSLPEWQSSLLILPSGRVRPVSYTVNEASATDAEAVIVGWEAPGAEDATPAAPVIAAILALAGSVVMTVAMRRTQRRTRSRPLVAPTLAELRLPSLGLALLFAAGATLVLFAVVDSLRPR